MKKFLIFIVVFLAFSVSFAHAKDEVTFIYINGSNTNDAKSKEWFYDGTSKFHTYLKKVLEQDPLTKNKMLKGKNIAQDARHIYWGEFSKAEIETLMEEINFLSLKSPKVAGLVRKYLAVCLHDAIWVAKAPNMYPIVDMTQEKVLEEYKKGNKVVLMGYSAGSFVAYQYILTKLPIINFSELASLRNLRGEEEYRKIILEIKPQESCIEAIFRDELVSYNLRSQVSVNPDLRAFKRNLAKLDEYTNLYCAPKDTVLGVINYASPLVLFYSEFSDPRYKLGEINSFMYKYFVEKGLFWLTVNYSDDPLGFPTTKNVTFEQVESLTGMPLKQNGGIFFDKSDLSSRRTFAGAHTSYWSTGKRFAKIVSDAYKEGYEYFYKDMNTGPAR